MAPEPFHTSYRHIQRTHTPPTTRDLYEWTHNEDPGLRRALFVLAGGVEPTTRCILPQVKVRPNARTTCGDRFSTKEPAWRTRGHDCDVRRSHPRSRLRRTSVAPAVTIATYVGRTRGHDCDVVTHDD
jgi:hypothetical protein